MKLSNTINAITLWVALATSPLASAKDETSNQINDVITSPLPSVEIEEQEILDCKDIKPNSTITLMNQVWTTKGLKWNTIFAIFQSTSCKWFILVELPISELSQDNFPIHNFRMNWKKWFWNIVKLPKNAIIDTFVDWIDVKKVTVLNH